MKNRVGILTNVDEACGNAAYARHLDNNLKKWYAVRRSTNINDFDGGDVVIVSYHPAVVELSMTDLKTVRDKGMKSIVILQNSFEGTVNVGKGSLFEYADALVAHEPMEGNVPIHYIPHGIPEIDLPFPDDVIHKENWFIGTAGFPFPWKRFDVVAEVCKRFSTKCMMIAPRSKFLDTDPFIDGIAGHLGPLAHIHREWLQEEEVIGYLSRCKFNIFWYESRGEDDTLGQTGSARMGIAANRPMIISRHRKFRTLFPYEDELYIADTEADIYKIAEDLLSNKFEAKRPNRLLKEMGWSKTAEMYKELIESL